MPKIPFSSLFRAANPDALDLLDRLLAFDPSARISVEEALEHRYLAIWHDASDEPLCPQTFDFQFEVVEDVGEMRRMILQEVRRFREHVRQPAHAQRQYQTQQPGNVPIPEETYAREKEEPRPQETYGQSLPYRGNDMGLEQELQGGLDAMAR